MIVEVGALGIVYVQELSEEQWPGLEACGFVKNFPQQLINDLLRATEAVGH